MGQMTTNTRPPTRTRRAPLWFRAVAIGWLTIVLFVLAGLLPTIRSILIPKALDNLPNLADFYGKQSAPVQIAIIALAVLLLIFSIWLAVQGWFYKQERQAEEKAAEDMRQQENVRAGTADVLKKPFEEIKEGQRHLRSEVWTARDEILEAVERRRPNSRIPPSHVSALSDLRRPASLVGRGDENHGELATVMDSLRKGKNLGVFALNGLAGVGKSALAAEAVARLIEDRHAFPGGAAWISAKSLIGSEGLVEIWTRVARRLGLSDVVSAKREQRHLALKAALAAHPRVLLA